MPAQNTKSPGTSKWKVIGIVLIVLFVVGVLIVALLYSIGSGVIERETECEINVCGAVEGAESYFYEEVDQICYCYDADEEVLKQQFLK